MQQFFGPEFYRANRRALRTAVGHTYPIVIGANGLMQRGGDEAFPFRQESNFWYLTGLSEPDITLVLGRNEEESYLIVPGRSQERVAFDGTQEAAKLCAISGIDTCMTEREGWRRLAQTLAHHKQVALLLPPAAYLKRHGLYTLPFRRRLVQKLRRLVPGVTMHDIRGTLAGLRVIKQPAELMALQSAIDITAATLADVCRPEIVQAAAHEYELEAAITYGFRRRGAEGHAFSPVVGAGEHTTTLHHVANNGPVTRGDLIVLDIGASVAHYAADITRTVSAQPLTGRAAEIFHAVLETQKYAVSQLRSGVLPIDYEHAVETYMGGQLKALGLITEVTHEQVRRYFPHATSHFLGLDTHDVGDYRQPYQEHMVITCEPGIYVPEEGIGVRIEDDVCITADGVNVLSDACPRDAFLGTIIG